MMDERQAVVDLVRSWIGKNEADGSHKEIIDIYNSLGKENLPRKILMQYSWAWCACTWSALAIKLGLTSKMPIEISCGYLVSEAKKLGCWQEKDDYIPEPGDAVLYDWDDNGKGDNTGWPDHVGVVNYVNTQSYYMEVIEGNCNDAVKKRTISINGRYIRGFITPKYSGDFPNILDVGPNKSIDEIAHEVIIGKWGCGDTRKRLLEASGYSYKDVQKRVNEILNGDAVQIKNPVQDQKQPIEKVVNTPCKARLFDANIAGGYKSSVNLYCRIDAGTDKKAMCVIPAGLVIRNYGYYTMYKGVRWLYISVTLEGVRYTGFCSGNFLAKV